MKIIMVNDNSDKVLNELEHKVERALEIIGMKAERYAKALCPVGTPESTGKAGYRGGTLRNSITYQIDVKDHRVSIGSNVKYAPYVELGTGPYFQAPPAWEQFSSTKGSGLGHGYVRPRPYLRPAIENHLNEYKDIVKSELKS